MALPVAIQLYSLREQLEKDFRGTLEAVKKMGYDGVEFAGLCGNKPEDVKKMLDEIGLVAISSHVTIGEYVNEGIDEVLEKYKTIGCKYVAVPYLDDECRPGAARYAETLDMMRKIGEAAAEKGMTQLYHNHDFEFKTKVNGKYGLEDIYDTIPAEYLKSELDTCWVNIGGEVPAEYILKYTGRAPIVHLKDFYMTGSLPKHLYALIGIEDNAEEEESTFEFRPVGHGMQDMPAILASSVKAGAEWVVVEQDDPTPGSDPIECATKSITYLKNLEW